MATSGAATSRMPLAWSIFLVCALMVVVAIAGSVGATRLIGERIAIDAVQKTIDKATQAQASLNQHRLELLERSTAVIANDPALAAYLSVALGNDLGLGEAAAPDISSLRDLLLERKQQFGFDLGILFDAKAITLARSDQGEGFASTLDRDPLITAAAQRLSPRSGYWLFEGRLHQATVTPLTHDGALVGFLLLAQRIDDALSREIARASGAEVAFWISQGGHAPLLLASSLAPERAGALRRAISGIGARKTSAPSGKEMLRRLNLKFDGLSWVVQQQAIMGEGGGELGTITAMASDEEVLSSYRQIFNLSVLAGLIALFAALPLSFGLSHRMLAPVRRLASAAEAAAAGDYERSVGVVGNDELARLGKAFSRLLSSLREKRDIESYIADVSRSLPDRVGGVATRAPIQQSTHFSQAALAIGSRLGERYEVLALLGSGGMGMVYKVQDLELGDVVALKLLHNSALQDAEQLDRLKEEIRLARKITHPNVLRTFDFGESSGRAFITMEYVRGITLRALLKQSGSLPYSAGLRIARQLASGLEAAHAAGVLHRDIKPENLILEANGNAKLMDFGIARQKQRHGEGLTQVGMVMGSPEYSSPEQLAAGNLDERSDIFSCGVLLSEMMCGHRPFQGDSPIEIYLAQVQDRVLPPSMFWSEIPPALEAIILRCIAIQTEQRYQNAREFGRALDQLREWE